MYICLSLSDISLSIMPSRSIHIVTNGKVSFLWLNIIPFSVYTTFSLYIHLWMNTYIIFISWLLWIILQWTWHIFFWVKCFCFLQVNYQNCCSSIFNFLRHFHTIFHSDYTNLHFHQKGLSIPFFSHPWRHFFFVIFLILAILTSVRCYLIMILICISLMINDVEHLFIYLLAICIPCLERRLFKTSAHF